VVIGEGEKDEAPMLYCGERIGTRKCGWLGAWVGEAPASIWR